MMLVELSTDRSIEGSEGLTAHVRSVIEIGLGRLGDHVTRVEVHLSDVNRSKSGPDDKQCMMEARLEGQRPMAVSHRAATVELAVTGATHLLKRTLSATLDRQRDLSRRGAGEAGL
jgi:hypothetical protein